MQLTFLGTGTSTGIPSIGCNCPVCRSTDPHDCRLRASAIVTVDDVNILIDSGPDFRQQILAAGNPPLDAMVITHSHYDHVGGIDDLRPYCYPDGFDVYCQKDVDGDLRARVPYCYAEHPYPGAPVFHNHIIEPLVPFKIKNVEILPLPVNHYLIDILGFRIGRLAYVTDAKTVPQVTIDRLKGIDTLVINALRHKRHISHMNLIEALGVINVVKPRVAYLTHMSHDMGLSAEVARTLPPNVHFAYDGLTITID